MEARTWGECWLERQNISLISPEYSPTFQWGTNVSSEINFTVIFPPTWFLFSLGFLPYFPHICTSVWHGCGIILSVMWKIAKHDEWWKTQMLRHEYQCARWISSSQHVNNCIDNGRSTHWFVDFWSPQFGFWPSPSCFFGARSDHIWKREWHSSSLAIPGVCVHRDSFKLAANASDSWLA